MLIGHFDIIGIFKSDFVEILDQVHDDFSINGLGFFNLSKLEPDRHIFRHKYLNRIILGVYSIVFLFFEVAKDGE